mmetsp:Transcript_102330/g.177909  ORF Transcript_102330/g.177909 Transcript_102330/m.177909 type:complete len:648 (+) Transcript_102330:1-1944(+)
MGAKESRTSTACQPVVGERYRLRPDIGFDEWRIRAEPNLQAAEVGFVATGDVVLVRALEGDWLHVVVEGTQMEGWSLGLVDGEVPFSRSISPAAATGTGEETARRLQFTGASGFTEWRIRARPHLDAPELACICLGDVVNVIAQEADWLHVTVEATSLQGWTLGVIDGRSCFQVVPATKCSWAVLVCGGARGSYYGTPSRPWRDFGGEIALLGTLGQVYAQMAQELGPQNVIVIAGLQSVRDWLRGMASLGYSEPFNSKDTEASKAYYGDSEKAKESWRRRLQLLEEACAVLLANGGADYDGLAVNPTTVLRVLAGDLEAAGRVVPRHGVTSLYFWVTTHGSAHPISIDKKSTPDGGEEPVPIDDRAVCETSCSLDANEWFWIMPHSATDLRPYDFVRLAGYTLDVEADPAAAHPHMPLFVVYWQQIFGVLHRMLELDPKRHIVTFYQFCLSGGHISFLQRPAIREHCGVDRWPIYMVASSAANQDSLGATLTNIFLEHLRRTLARGGRSPLGVFFKQLESLYWQQHTRIAQMNRSLPEFMRMGEIQQYHTPDSGVENMPVSAIFSNRLPLLEALPADAAMANADADASLGSDATLPAAEVSDATSARAQLMEVIFEMGFTDREAVEEALNAANGHADLALEILLSR